MNRSRKPVIYRGAVYPSQAALGRAYGRSHVWAGAQVKSGAAQLLADQKTERKAEASRPKTPVQTAARELDFSAAARALRPVFHPKWSPRLDLDVLQAKESGLNFSAIAVRIGRQRIAVEQRWHRLRAIRRVNCLLMTYLETRSTYPFSEGVAP